MLRLWLFEIGLGKVHQGGVQGQSFRLEVLTIDSDSNALAQNEPVFALEGWDFPKRVDLEVLGTHALRWLLDDNLEFEAICLRNSQEYCCARVVLQKSLEYVNKAIITQIVKEAKVGKGNTYGVSIDLSERHTFRCIE